MELKWEKFPRRFWQKGRRRRRERERERAHAEDEVLSVPGERLKFLQVPFDHLIGNLNTQTIGRELRTRTADETKWKRRRGERHVKIMIANTGPGGNWVNMWRCFRIIDWDCGGNQSRSISLNKSNWGINSWLSRLIVIQSTVVWVEWLIGEGFCCEVINWSM